MKKPDREQLDKKWKLQKFPQFIKKQPRSILEHFQYFQAIEFFIFFIYYFELFQEYLPQKYYNNTLSLVKVIRNLFEPCTKNQIEEYEKNLLEYLKEAEKLFGVDFMKFVTHSIMHIPLVVKKHGILSFLSTFPYESYNSVFMASMKAYNCSQFSLQYFDLKQSLKEIGSFKYGYNNGRVINGFTFKPQSQPNVCNYCCVEVGNGLFEYGWITNIVADNTVTVKFENYEKPVNIYKNDFHKILPVLLTRNQDGRIENRIRFFYYTKLFVIS
jgi:hypothetical protein